MADGFSFSVKGQVGLARMFNSLPEKVQERVIRPIFEKSVERMKNEVLLNLSGRVVRERTGRYVNAMERKRVNVSVNLQKGTVDATMRTPARALLGIDPKAKGYYPFAVEYGAKKGPRIWAGKAPIRKGVNRVQQSELNRVTTELARGILREARVAR